ncbi:MAG TPA: hypothetical protein VF618_08515 [Thermoanaerobaculia bacterium]
MLSALAALANCNTTDRTRRGYLRAEAEHAGAPRRPVIVIAGFGVTRLVDPETGRHVWGTAHAMWQRTYPDDLDLPLDAEGNIGRDRLVPRGWVGSRGPVNTGWQLSIALRKYGGYTLDENLYPFYYDWRLPARENARLLAARVEEIRLEHDGAQVDLVTHSAGALIASTYLKLEGGADDVARLVMVAPVQRGVIEAFRIFVRPERFIRRGFSPEMVATWPFITELLPENGRIFIDPSGAALPYDVWELATWTRFVPLDARHTAALARSLANARAFRDELRNTPMPLTPTVIAGDCVPTARRVLVRGDNTFVFYPGELTDAALRDVLFEPGDGTVPISSARGDAATMTLCDGHQGIAADPHVHRAILRALR